MFLKISLLFFVIFFGNVFWSSLGNKSFFTDVVELGILCLSVLFFVMGILRAEASK